MSIEAQLANLSIGDESSLVADVKAKTAEKMGPVGRGEAIEARAVCLLVGLADPSGGEGRGAVVPPDDLRPLS